MRSLIRIGPKKHHRYSGPNSAPFWSRVAKLKDERDHASLYSLGCAIQNLEEYVLQQLANAEPHPRQARFPHRLPQRASP